MIYTRLKKRLLVHDTTIRTVVPAYFLFTQARLNLTASHVYCFSEAMAIDKKHISINHQ